MKEFIEPYQYNFIKNQLANVSRAYRSANDTSTLKALKSLTEEKINELFPESVLEEHKELFSKQAPCDYFNQRSRAVFRGVKSLCDSFRAA